MCVFSFYFNSILYIYSSVHFSGKTTYCNQCNACFFCWVNFGIVTIRFATCLLTLSETCLFVYICLITFSTASQASGSGGYILIYLTVVCSSAVQLNLFFCFIYTICMINTSKNKIFYICTQFLEHNLVCFVAY